jgi:hypothetical protein
MSIHEVEKLVVILATSARNLFCKRRHHGDAPRRGRMEIGASEMWSRGDAPAVVPVNCSTRFSQPIHTLTMLPTDFNFKLKKYLHTATISSTGISMSLRLLIIRSSASPAKALSTYPQKEILPASSDRSSLVDLHSFSHLSASVERAFHNTSSHHQGGELHGMRH